MPKIATSTDAHAPPTPNWEWSEPVLLKVLLVEFKIIASLELCHDVAVPVMGTCTATMVLYFDNFVTYLLV
eukprot:CAMPEP_0174994756 /NCGR_PEP_ID=MMETSP0004_2-20121128/23807_1 /TAXON_ID=420556 /ORGANISM="Ochromonas sp., Strain CCMP1393" /LENGTH=70 /DNA_ID=CAMNT_0016249017 /DNA_START=287 /DNA_END=496 /DNA_ORIENTATION=-